MTELIDRQAALKKMCETCGYCEDMKKHIPSIRLAYQDFVIEKCNCYKFLAEQPTIESETVRHGCWVSNYEESPTVYCSECGAGAGKALAKWYKCCPYCGAKMDGRVTD